MKSTAISLANEAVPIALACRLVGLDVDFDAAYGKSLKVYCPFGDIHHSDGGESKAMRIYPDTNSCFCFAGCGHFSAVRLVAHAWDRPAAEVAVELLERIGYTPLSLAAEFASHATWKPAPDTAHLAEALKMFCRRVTPDWDRRQFDPLVAGRLARCLALLDRVRTDEDAATWLHGAKTHMHHILTTLTGDRT